MSCLGNREDHDLFFSVIICNYNYEEYISEAIGSVLNQTCQDFEVIVVDDGSTDSSRERIDSYDDNRIKKIYKQNEGQGCAFRDGCAAAVGKWFCFLDSDDVWSCRHLEYLQKVVVNEPSCGFIFTGRTHELELLEREPAETVGQKKLGYFCGCTRALRWYVGSSTSTLAIAGSSAKQILQYPYLQYWRIRADDLLVFGSSIFGLSKIFLSGKTVFYRQHGSNSFLANNNFTREEMIRRTIELEKLFSWLTKTAGLSARVSYQLLRQELESIPSLKEIGLLRRRPKIRSVSVDATFIELWKLRVIVFLKWYSSSLKRFL